MVELVGVGKGVSPSEECCRGWILGVGLFLTTSAHSRVASDCQPKLDGGVFGSGAFTVNSTYLLRYCMYGLGFVCSSQLITGLHTQYLYISQDGMNCLD